MQFLAGFKGKGEGLFACLKSHIYQSCTLLSLKVSVASLTSKIYKNVAQVMTDIFMEHIMENNYSHKETLVLPKPKDVTFTRRRSGTD